MGGWVHRYESGRIGWKCIWRWSRIYICTLRCNLSSQTLNQLQKTTRRWQDKDEKHILHVRSRGVHSQCTPRLFSHTLKIFRYAVIARGDDWRIDAGARRFALRCLTQTKKTRPPSVTRPRTCPQNNPPFLLYPSICFCYRSPSMYFPPLACSLAQCWVFYRMLKASNTVMSLQSPLSWEWGLSWMLNGPQHSRWRLPLPGPCSMHDL